jgi:hypothetical protein
MKVRRLAKTAALVLAVSAVVATAAAYAAKPQASGPSLYVHWPQAAATTATSSSSTSYIVAGCGYGSQSVKIVVYSPTAASFTGQMPDANGCISVSNFYTTGPGHYSIEAWQQSSHSKWGIVASTGFDA